VVNEAAYDGIAMKEECHSHPSNKSTIPTSRLPMENSHQHVQLLDSWSEQVMVHISLTGRVKLWLGRIARMTVLVDPESKTHYRHEGKASRSVDNTLFVPFTG